MIDINNIVFTVTLDNFYHLGNPEWREAIESMFTYPEECIVHSVELAMYMFASHGFDISAALDYSEVTCYELLYDDYIDEWELSPAEAECALLGMNQLIRDTYPVVMSYASYLLANGEDYRWLLENIEDSSWSVHTSGYSHNSAYDEVSLLVEVISDSY